MPALFFGNFSDNPVSGIDVKSPVRLDDFHGCGMGAVDHDMDVKIARILVRRNDRLVFGKSHALKENSRCLNDLFPDWKFIFRPTHDPMGYRHFALHGFLGRRACCLRPHGGQMMKSCLICKLSIQCW